MKLSFVKGALVPADDEARAIGKRHKIGDVIDFEVLHERSVKFNAKIHATLDEIAKMLDIEMEALRAEILIETGRAHLLKLRDGKRVWALPSMSRASMSQKDLSDFWDEACEYIRREVMISLDGDQQERVNQMIGAAT